MAAEEFQESDVFFSGDHREVSDLHHNHHHRHRRQRSRNNKKQKKSGCGGDSSTRAAAAPSVPVDIPTNVFRFGDSDEYEEEEDDEEEEEGSIIPPHVTLARRVAGKMAFSVCTGNGRTLKGRDLSQVRNSILRMTGFLET